MARRSKKLTKTKYRLIGYVIIISLLIYCIVKLGETIGWGMMAVGVFILSYLWFGINKPSRKIKETAFYDQNQENLPPTRNNVKKKLFKFLGDPTMGWYGAELPPDSVFLSLINELKNFQSDVADDFFRQSVISDCYLIVNMLKEAYEWCPLPVIGQQAAWLSNRRLNLLHAIGKDITAIEVLSLFPKRLTEYGKDNLQDIICIIDEQIVVEAKQGNILEATLATDPVKVIDPPIFNGTLYSRPFDLQFPWFDFTQSLFLKDKIKAMTRFAENILREEQGLPAVGEGWIAETELYHHLQMAFPDQVIQHHASPKWLGRQHLDIYFPESLIGVEYQGSQHKMPVAYFGGVTAFVEQRKRDRRKKMLCTRNGVKILYVEKGYSLPLIVYEIRDAMKEK